MTTLAESLVSSSSRPLTVRKRPDLSSSRHRYQGTGYWVIKEPVGLQYFRFHDEEYFILNMLDGHVSLQHIKDGFEQRFAPQKITFGDLQQFIGMLHRSGLVISNSPGQGKALRHRGRKKRNKETL
ncbi:MAG: hemolysin D, partial [Planctomycetota bacterium]